MPWTWQNVTGTWSELNQMERPAMMDGQQAVCRWVRWAACEEAASEQSQMGAWCATTTAPEQPSLQFHSWCRLGCQMVPKRCLSCFSVAVARNVTERIHFLNNLTKDREERERTWSERDRTYNKNITLFKKYGGTWRNLTGTCQNVEKNMTLYKTYGRTWKNVKNLKELERHLLKQFLDWFWDKAICICRLSVF